MFDDDSVRRCRRRDRAVDVSGRRWREAGRHSGPTAVSASGRPQPPTPIPLKVTVVLSRFQGEKRVSSMPYVIGVMASGWGRGPRPRSAWGSRSPSLRRFSAATASRTPSSSYPTAPLTNIDCGATFDEAVAGVFQLDLTVSDSSLGLDATKKTAQGVVPDVPSFRNFNSSFTALLRDGRTMQHVGRRTR